MLQPVAPRLDWALLEGRMRSRNDEIDDLMALLLDHADRAAGPKAELYHVAWQIACASLGDQHLWQDLGLPSAYELLEDDQDAVAEVWRRYLRVIARDEGLRADHAALVAAHGRFFYRQLCLKEDILICKSPSCAGCPDVGLCFGPETASPVQLAEAKA